MGIGETAGLWMHALEKKTGSNPLERSRNLDADISHGESNLVLQLTHLVDVRKMPLVRSEITPLVRPEKSIFQPRRYCKTNSTLSARAL
jgi:hypothetical protein